jgi:hypothetical protein
MGGNCNICCNAMHQLASAAAAAAAGLDKNDYQQDLCSEAFQAFKDCRAHQVREVQQLLLLVTK